MAEALPTTQQESFVRRVWALPASLWGVHKSLYPVCFVDSAFLQRGEELEDDIGIMLEVHRAEHFLFNMYGLVFTLYP